MRVLRLGLFCCVLMGLSGCYQIHSDDNLRTVPTTNNPNLIHDPYKGGPPGVAY